MMESISNPSGLTLPRFLLNSFLRGNLSAYERDEQRTYCRGSSYAEPSACLTIWEDRDAGFLGDTSQNVERVIDCKSISLYSPSAISQNVAIRTILFQIITFFLLEHG